MRAREESAAARQQFTRQKLWRTALDLDEQLPLPTLFSVDFLIHFTVFISFRAREINKQDVYREIIWSKWLILNICYTNYFLDANTGKSTLILFQIQINKNYSRLLHFLTFQSKHQLYRRTLE